MLGRPRFLDDVNSAKAYGGRVGLSIPRIGVIAGLSGLANNGYAYVVQDCRGRFDSDGVYYPFHEEGPDGFDTQEWIGRQEWSSGKIGSPTIPHSVDMGWCVWTTDRTSGRAR